MVLISAWGRGTMNRIYCTENNLCSIKGRKNKDKKLKKTEKKKGRFG